MALAPRAVRRADSMCCRSSTSGIEAEATQELATTATTATTTTPTTATTATTAAAAASRGGKFQGCVLALCRLCLLLAIAAVWSLFSVRFAPSELGDLRPDQMAAHALFEEAAVAGHWGAAYALAMIKLDGENKSEAEPYLRQLAQEGDEAARAFAGYFQHRWGLGVERDPRRAGQLLEEAATMGEPNAALLLAEAHTHDDTESVILPGGRNLSMALNYYRAAASRGVLSSRYNVGVLLVKSQQSANSSSSGILPEDLSLDACLEARAEFAEVARDMDPTVRLLFALAMRSSELGDSSGALGLFMLLSEAGVGKAHRNAAKLWEDRLRGLEGLGEVPKDDGTEAGAASSASVQGRVQPSCCCCRCCYCCCWCCCCCRCWWCLLFVVVAVVCCCCCC
ncbi:unnamed protein product [Polarella glacialis]|uniref:Uncharacterized protein n=1 Tax=Polarella glacialis TaxID=89957 RepID=A0A813JAV9_POLGL|nr:unnamed protein product [Polarella glacialis]